MSTDRDVTGVVRAWLEEGVTALPDRVLDSVMEQLPATHQRRARRPAWRLNTMSTFRLAAIAASISVLAVLVGIVPRAIGPGGTNSTASPSPVTTPTLPPTACPPGTPLSNGTIATVAGGASGVAAVDGGPAIAGTLGQPTAVAVDPTGAIYFSDTARLVVRRIAPDGVITTVAGTGRRGDSGDGGPATAATFKSPAGLVFDAAGNLYVADMAAGRIRKIDTAGIISTFAGNGTSASSGNGGPATSAEVNAGQLSIGPDGSLYFDDSNNFRTIGTDGIIRAFAGTGVAGYSGDGGPAVDATLGEVNGAAVDAAGNVYLGDAGGHRIRKVDTSGTITTFAGTGQLGHAGDGGPATEATFDYPASLALDSAGDLYVSDWLSANIRVIGTDGVVRPVAGTGGLSGFAGDCGPATSAHVGGTSSPTLGLAAHGGVLYVADANNGRIRIVIP